MTNLDKLPKLIASDIGGTLVSGINPIPNYTANVLNQLIQMGKPVALITGYNYHSTHMFSKYLDKRVILMPQNGALCIRDEKIIWEYHISEERINRIYHYFEENDFPVIFFKGKHRNFKNCYIYRKEIPSLSYGFDRVSQLDGKDNITGISTLVPEERVTEAKSKLKEIVGESYQVIYSRSGLGSWLEVCNAKVRKDFALIRLCDEYSIPLADALFMGDGFNDLEALRIVGYPVLVENAVEELKSEFQTIIPPVSEQGAALFLKDLYNLSFQ